MASNAEADAAKRVPINTRPEAPVEDARTPLIVFGVGLLGCGIAIWMLNAPKDTTPLRQTALLALAALAGAITGRIRCVTLYGFKK